VNSCVISFDDLKSVSSGFASISYEIGEMRKADVTRLDILVADEPVADFLSGCRAPSG